MSQEFSSLRKKLVIKLGVTYLLALMFIFTLIIVKNTFDFNATIAETEQRLKASLTNKGMLLVKNNSAALLGLVEDNAFSAVKQIVTETVNSSSDVVYGIFSDAEQNNWVYVFKNEELERYKNIVDQNAIWAVKQTQAGANGITFEQLQILEFAAPVVTEGERLGVIRYGLSTAALMQTIASANEQATESLLQTLVALVVVGLITLLIAYWRTNSVARDITIPLNQLTDAANIVANGQYQQIENIQTNDEVELLANNFNVMTNTIKRTIADLAKINQIGHKLANTRDDMSAFALVLKGLMSQLKLPLGLVLVQAKNSSLTLLASDNMLLCNTDNIVKQLNNYDKIQHFIESESTQNYTLINDVIASDNGITFESLIFIACSTHNDMPLYLALLSNKPKQHIESSEVEFYFSIRHLLISSLRNITMNEMLEEQNKSLEDKVNQRTHELSVQNQALSKTLTELEQMQDQLVEAEKMASLGSLVAGISHEVNTPLGVSVTAASHLSNKTKEFSDKFSQGKLTKSSFVNYMNSTRETTEIILTNLDRAATLIQSFKQIAVDQSSDVVAKFDLKSHLQMLVVSLGPTYKALPITINISGDEITISSFPGVINQVVTNLIMNSIKHGLTPCDEGAINIIISQYPSHFTITVADNGIGVEDEIKGKIFDPFFTTKRGSGGTGLGLHIVYNLVTQKLFGDIRIEDNTPQGTRFIVSLPYENHH